METVFLEAMLPSPCFRPPDYVLFQLCRFPVNYNEDCLLRSVLRFCFVGFFGGWGVLKCTFHEALLVFSFSLSFIFPRCGTKP